MKFYYASDLHMESGHGGEFSLKQIPDKEESYLILAGDVTAGQSFHNLKKINELPFKGIFYILGNHEFYDNEYRTLIRDMKCFLSDNCRRFVFLDSDSIAGVFEHPEFRIIGCTLWTSFKNENHFVMEKAHRFMNDYRNIDFVPSLNGKDTKIKPKHIAEIHREEFNFLEGELKKEGSTKPVIVITHHAPSFKSVHDRFKKNILEFENNYWFVEPNCERLMLDYEPDYWIHGHVHDSFEYEIGKTKVLCNPYGYDFHFHEVNPNFSNKFFEV